MLLYGETWGYEGRDSGVGKPLPFSGSCLPYLQPQALTRAGGMTEGGDAASLADRQIVANTARNVLLVDECDYGIMNA